MSMAHSIYGLSDQQYSPKQDSGETKIMLIVFPKPFLGLISTKISVGHCVLNACECNSSGNSKRNNILY